MGWSEPANMYFLSHDTRPIPYLVHSYDSIPLKLVLQIIDFLFSFTVQALQERMVKDFKSKMKEIQKKHDDEKQKLQKDLEKERQKTKDHKKSIEKEVR